MSEDIMKDQRFPGMQWHDIGNNIEWNYYKHWGQGVWAGEGFHLHHGVSSGCIHIINGHDYTSPPIVVLARTYRLKHHTGVGISAVFSYPKGLGIVNDYFWEIYPGRDGDIERFIGEHAEQEMEEAIKEILIQERTSHL